MHPIEIIKIRNGRGLDFTSKSWLTPKKMKSQLFFYSSEGVKSVEKIFQFNRNKGMKCDYHNTSLSLALKTTNWRYKPNQILPT